MIAVPNDKTMLHFEKARQVIPGGLMSNFRKEENYVPTYYSRGEQAHLYDIDGNEYIDYSLGYGPMILGHSNEHFMKALTRQARSFASCEVNTLERQAAEKVVQHVPCADLVRFACSGTDAVYNALRIARAYTGKNKVVRFNGHYHGGLDGLLGGVVDDADKSVPAAGERNDDIFSRMTNTMGRAAHCFDDQLLIEWNDLTVLGELLDAHGHDTAAVLMEPAMVNVSGCMPIPGYIDGVRTMCDAHNVLLIFDEVLTGFRMGLGGAQNHYGVTPDLATFAKALGNGMPVSAFCGRREVMDVVTHTEVIAGGTYNGHPLSMAAVVATIEELERDDAGAMKHISRLGGMLGDGLRELFSLHNVNLLLQGFDAAWTLSYHDEKNVINNHAESLGVGLFDKVGLFVSLMNKHGVAMQTRFCTSAAHTLEDVQSTLERADDALRDFKQIVERA